MAGTTLRHPSQYSAANLKELKKGSTISIVYKPSPTSDGQIIASNFPKNVATAFSSKWANDFPPLNRMKPGQKMTAKTSVTIVGGMKEDHKKILEWMMDICDGSGFRHFEFYPAFDKHFSKYYILRSAAAEIGCGYLEAEFQARMNRIAEKQIHSEDVRQMYKTLPEGHDDLKYLGAHVAAHLLNKSLKTPSPYFTLREEIKAFDQDINDAINPMIEERRAKNKADHDERVAESMKRRQEARQRSKEPSEADSGTTDSDGVVRTQIKARITRTKVIGQGSDKKEEKWARLDLSSVGVEKSSFVSSPYRGAKSRRSPGQGAKQEDSNKQKETVDAKTGEGEVNSEKLAAAEEGVKNKEQGKQADKGDKNAKGLEENKAGDDQRKEEKKANESKKGLSNAETEDVTAAGHSTTSVPKASVPGADLNNSSNKNARRRAKARAAAITDSGSSRKSSATTLSQTQSNESNPAGETDNRGTWAEEMDEAHSA